MKKFFERCLFVILVLGVIYLVYDYFWQRNRDREFGQVLSTMARSMDGLENFLRENRDDLEYLVKKCTEDEIYISAFSVDSTKGNHREVTVDQEVLSRRDRLIAKIPDSLCLYDIDSSRISFHTNDAVPDTTLYLVLTSPPLTQGYAGRVVGNIGTIEAGRTWTVDVASYSHFHSDCVRAEKMLKKVEEQA